MVDQVTKDAAVIEYGGWVGDSYYRPQRVPVARYHELTRIPFNSTFDFKAAERPSLAIALVDGDPVRLLVGTVSSDETTGQRTNIERRAEP